MSKNNNNLIIGVVVIVVVLILFGFFGFGGYRMMGGYNSGFMLIGWILNILIIVLVVLGILWLFKNINYNRRR